MRKIRISALALTAVTLTTLAGCTGKAQTPGGQPATSGTPSSAPSLATATQPAPETQESASQHAIDAYITTWNAFFAAGQKGDPADPALAKHASGAALTLLVNGLKSNQAKGLLERGQAIYRPKVTQLIPATSPVKASLQDCMDTSATSLYKANGDPYKDTPGGLRLVFADVERIEGVWKVTTLAVREVGSCGG